MTTVIVWFLVVLNPVTGTVAYSRSVNMENTAPLTQATCLSEAAALTAMYAARGTLAYDRAVCVPKQIGVKL